MLVTPKSLAITLATLLAAATLAFVYLPKIGQAEQKTTEATENTEKIDSQKKSAAQDATQKNLKKLIMAVQNNVGNRDNLPANALYDPERRPLLSWRVYILPFLAEEKLYSEFHLGEPWDSEHNRKLIARMPAVFKNPKIDKPGFTNYLAVVGKECVFNGTPNGLRLRDITDGTSKTIAIVEANAELAVEWTKPQDWKFDRATPTKGLGQQWGDGWYAAWVDGSVRRTENSEPADKIGIQFTRAGGEIESLKESANGVSSLEGGMGSPPGMNEGMPVAGAAGAGPAAAKFPSLDDQKLADLAWKRLGLELEPIAGDDLQRVKAFGYDGGLKVVGGGSAVVGNVGTPVTILPGDILVGLHVWPTTNLKDIATILNRDDLAELNPLKFYVVRRIPERMGGSPADPGKDNVITGRINVELAGTVNLDRTNTQESDESARAALKSARDRFLPFEQAVVNAQANLEQAKANSADVQGAQRVLDAAQQHFEEAQKSYRAVVRRFVKIVPSSDEPLPVHPAPPPTQLQPASLPSPPYSVTFDRYNAGPSTTTPTPPDQNATTFRSVLINPSNAAASNNASAAGEVFERLKKQLQMSENARNKAADLISLTKRAKEEASKRLQKGDGTNEDTERVQLQIKMADKQLAIAEAQLKGFQEQYAKAQKEFDEFTRSDRYSRMLAAQPTTEETPTSDSPPLAPRASQLAPSTSAPPILAPQTLRYDGKPFEEWRNVWKTELSTEKRIEAVKALDAFGRAGYGQEAAAAILDVAGEYDFLAMDDSPEGKLKQVVLDELTPESHEHSSAKFWIPVLANRLQGDSKKWKWLACNLLDRLRTDDKASLKIVQGLASIDDNSIRGSVIGAVVRGARTGKYPLDESTRKLIDESLESKDPEMVRIALIYMVSYPPPGNALDSQPALPYQPTALPKLLFHADSEVRRQARRLLPLLDDKATTDLVDQLIAILKDQSRQRDHLDAIRACATLGKKTSKATPALADILKSSDNQSTLAATMVALARIAYRRAENVIIQGVQPQFVKHNFGIELTPEESRTLQNRIGGEDGTKQKEFLERLRQEEQQVPSLQNANRGGGGVF